MAECRYCIDCVHLKLEATKAETYMDSGEYVQTGYHYRCPVIGRNWNCSKDQMEYVHASCFNGYEENNNGMD